MFFGDVHGWDERENGGRRGHKWEGLYVYMPLIHFIVRQKLTQRYKATIPQLKNFFSSSLNLFLPFQSLSFNQERGLLHIVLLFGL